MGEVAWQDLAKHFTAANRDDGRLLAASVALGQGYYLVLGTDKRLKGIDPTLDVRPVNQLWDLVAAAAGQGLTGLVDLEAGQFLHFVCRLEDAAAALPAALADTPGFPTEILTRYGPRPNADLLVAWSRFDLIDAARDGEPADSASPWPEWNPGAEFYQLRQGSAMPMIGDLAVEGPFPDHFGAFCLFTSADAAAHFAQHIRAVAWHHPVAEPPDPHNQSLEVESVPDFVSWTEDLAAVRPNSPVVIDPQAGRTRVGRSVCGSSLIRTCTGIWRVTDGNQMTFEQGWPIWTRRDTLHWPGRGSGITKPPVRTFATTAEVAIGDEDHEGFADFKRERDTSPPEQLGEAFILAIADVMSDDVLWLAFDGFYSAAKYLESVALKDEANRVDGYEPLIPLGRAGSGDKSLEARRTRALCQAINRLRIRVARVGYEPPIAEALAAACAQVLHTTRLEAAGYARDLVWGLRDDTVWFDRLLEAFGSESRALESWLTNQGGLPIDGRGEALCLARIPAATWGALDQRSKHFLATALAQWDSQAASDQLDFAPIAVETCKSLEVEIGRVFSHFRDYWVERHGLDASPHLDDQDRNDLALGRLIQGRKLELGSMQYLLRPTSDPTPLRQALQECIGSHPNGAFLTSKALSKALYRVTGTYRNGSAHDSPLSRETARAAIDEIVGNGQDPGLLERIVVQRTPAERGSDAPGLQWQHHHDRWELLVSYPDDRPRHAPEWDDVGDEALWSAQDLGHLLAHAPDFHEHFSQLVDDEQRAKLKTRWQVMTRGEDGVPPIGCLYLQQLEAFELEHLSPLGMLFEDDKGSAARLAPGLAAGVESGQLWFMVIHDDPDLGADSLRVNLDAISVSQLARAVSRRRIDWTHPARFLTLLRRSAEEPMLLRLARSGPPGGMMSYRLKGEQAELLIEIIRSADVGAWGPLASRDQRPSRPTWLSSLP